MTEPLRNVPVPTHTEEARELLAAGIISPGDKSLDVPPDSMTDRDLLVEILIHQRNTRDTVNALISAIAASPVASMMGAGSLNGFLR